MFERIFFTHFGDLKPQIGRNLNLQDSTVFVTTFSYLFYNAPLPPFGG